MAKFFGSVLNVLSRVYPLTAGGQQNVDQLDMRSPISLVHDVAREVELGGGFFSDVTMPVTLALDNTTTFADLTVSGSTGLLRAAIAKNVGPGTQAVPDDVIASYRAWLIGVSVTQGSGLTPAWASLHLSRTGVAAAGADATARRLLFFGTTVTNQLLTTGVGGVLPGANFSGPQSLPQLLDQDGTLRFSARVSAGAPADMLFSLRLWVGAIGVPAPGLA